MTTSTLTIDLDALAGNWRALDAASDAGVETSAVVKANGYGLDAGRVARTLARAGARKFCVAVAEEAAAIRQALGPGPEIYVFSGHGRGDTDMIHDLQLTPMLNSIDQMLRHVEALPGHGFGVQLDTGMNRLGMEPAEWAALRDIALGQNIQLIMSHLACADEPEHPMNAQQLQVFNDLTQGCDIPRSLSATGGILLGPEYHFDVTRPGIGLYGGFPFSDAQPVAYLSLPVIQIRDVAPGETVGYGNTWTAARPSRIATVSAGYADGLHRIMAPRTQVYANGVPCPLVGRISMDLITIDITELSEDPDELELLNAQQTVDDLANNAGTIGYEILTALGGRYHRRYVSS
ncbi:Alanine racemase, biosynthetic [Thalassovita gelatinovora]|uniref:Alanine racemase n=1 Tax=Thalassovita gelatinovora TaxID=53501 RepID=A0A0P1FKE3_THAGE|nr:alanine racemase [Thalassovita gelatinovora]QIZ82351.1 alanine racemase [Thalassovita gelatinovora]CUH68420.1 Alanine racemase, biosynthetic [Thalassovita gelatinovora]SEQ51649.1 alanine racemase [Thalassovita gelatinovora]